MVLIYFFLVDSFSVSLFLSTFVIFVHSKLIFFLLSLFPYGPDFPVGAILVYSFMFFHLGI